ncbi:hypothetical protein M5D96_008595 [Drosophila gunungcola]|uniref:Uncharacterized protein n=2 Tax=Drosophila gunungcola TaxID=103775 RepID=A0A9Q0BN78_9MUSC|nr:hypothetical protein M5D96_008595 [Drosophila gunungcola]
MANCDNLDMELDEEELYFLQLTSNTKDQENEDDNLGEEVSKDFESPVKGAEFLLQENKDRNLTAVQKEKDLSLKDNDQNNVNIKLLDIKGKTKKLLVKKQFDSEVHIFKEPAIKSAKTAPIKNLPQLSAIEAKKSVENSNLRSLTLLEESLDSDLNSFKERKTENPDSTENINSPLFRDDFNPDAVMINNVEREQELDLKSFKAPENPLNQESCDILPTSNASLFGSDSDLESETSELNDSNDSEMECGTSDNQTDFKKQSIVSLFGNDSDSDGNEAYTEAETMVEENNSEQKTIKNDPDNSNSFDSLLFKNCSDSRAAKEPPSKEQSDTESESSVSQDWLSLPLPADADLVSIMPPIEDSSSGDEGNESQLPKEETNSSSNATSNLSGESEDEHSLVIDEQTSVVQPEESPSPPPVQAKRRKTQHEILTPSPCREVRLTRQRAKQLLNEEKSSQGKGSSLVEQIRNQLKEALTKSEPLKKNTNMDLSPVEPKTPKAEEAHTEPILIRQTHTISEESPASPVSEPTDDLADPPIEIPLEQAACRREDGEPKSILLHVIDVDKGLAKLNKVGRKTLGKLQPQLCSVIGKYLQDTMQLESSCCDLALEIYKLTKDEFVIVSAMITVICRIGTEERPVERLLNALKYFNFTQRFLAELEERLFRNTKERPANDLALMYVKLYLKAVCLQATLSAEYENPARLLLAKILYHFDRDMPKLVMELLRQFPTVLPHREQREYDHADPLITVIKHLLMNRTYDMQDPEGAERLLLSKLRFEYHFQPFEPTKQQVLENLMEKLKAGRLAQLGYAFALFCRRSAHLKVLDSVLGEHLMPLATSYCDLAAQNKSYDDRLVILLQCISLVLKPLPLETDISAFVGFFKRLLVAVPRSGVQLAAVQASLRLQRFGFTYTLDALKDYRPSYQLDPLTRAMLRCFAERRRQFRRVAATGKARRD